MLSFSDVLGSHSQDLLSKQKKQNNEWQDLGPWINEKIQCYPFFFKGVWESDLHLLFTDSGLFSWYQTHTHMQKAIDGITPVFNSVLRAGVIVPCKEYF